MKVVWTEDAEADLENIVHHIANDDVAAALRMDDRIRQAVGRLTRLPRSGRRGSKAGTYELVVARSPYLVIYELDGDEIGVARVLHGAQQWPPSEQ